MGLSNTGRRPLDNDLVSGQSLVPEPPVRIIPFMSQEYSVTRVYGSHVGSQLWRSIKSLDVGVNGEISCDGRSWIYRFYVC